MTMKQNKKKFGADTHKNIKVIEILVLLSNPLFPSVGISKCQTTLALLVIHICVEGFSI
jgi:hypothetical protein